MESSVSNQVNFSEKEMMKYSRNIMLADIGVEGQRLLKNSTVTIIGVGGLGCACSQYLVASGIGNLNLFDPDQVDLSNLQRQILYREEDLNAFKFYEENKTDFPTDLKNDFEYFVRKVYPEINEIFNLMSQYGNVELSGTGSSMYLNFKSSEEAYTIATKVPTNCKFFVTRSLDKSPIYDELKK